LESERDRDGRFQRSGVLQTFCCAVNPTLATAAERDHTPTMNLKSAAMLALVGMILLTILVAADFLITVSGVMHDVLPAMSLLRSLINMLATLTVTLFLFVFHKNQS